MGNQKSNTPRKTPSSPRTNNPQLPIIGITMPYNTTPICYTIDEKDLTKAGPWLRASRHQEIELDHDEERRILGRLKERKELPQLTINLDDDEEETDTN
jgi:hypothetical protein